MLDNLTPKGKTAIFIFCILFIPSLVLSKDSITWYYPNFPPTNIIEGPYKGEGLVGNIYTHIFPLLNDYEHETSVANFKRIIKNMRLQTNSCNAALLWNKERNAIVEYSVPYTLVHPVRLIINKKDLPKFEAYKQKNGAYSLNEILKDEKLYLGYSNGRSYSKVLDESLKTLVSDKNSVLSTQSFILGGLLKMLSRNRIDYTLGYSPEVNFLAKSLHLEDSLMTLTIHEANDLIPVYIGCPKNEWGRQIIAKLNPFLLKYRSSDTFYSPYVKWLDDEALKGYPQLVEKYFQKE